MRVLKLLLLVLIISLAAHSQAEFYDCPKEKRQEFIPKFRLDRKFQFTEDADFILIHYIQRYDCSENHHFGTVAELYFSIPAALSSFEMKIERKDSMSTPLIYNTICGCGPRYAYNAKSSSGTIRGSLVNGVWQIDGVIKLYLYNRHRDIALEKDISVAGIYKNQKRK